jgi:hypothetical protein
LYGGGAFVSAIMVYYIAFYFIQKYLINHLNFVLIGVVIVSFLIYPLAVDKPMFNMYGGTLYKWFVYFSYMLLGAIMGLRMKHCGSISIRNGWMELLKTLGCTALFFGAYAFKSSIEYNCVQTLSILPLLGIDYYMYRLCNADGIKRVYKNKYIGSVMKFISGLCLEIYIVQMTLINDSLNSIFPLNLLVIFTGIVLLAYILRCLARIWSQTFKDDDYKWKAVIEV